MKKKLILLYFLSILLIVLAGCSGSSVTTIEKTETDAPERKVNVSSDVEQKDMKEEIKEEPTIYKVGEKVIINDEYALTILGAIETEDRNQFSDQEVAQVLIIDYIYENLSNDLDDTYISEMDFKFVDEGGNMCDSYPTSGRYSPNYAPNGARSLASMAIGTVENSQRIKINYYDNFYDSDEIVEFDIAIGEYVEPILDGKTPEYEGMYNIGDIIEVKTEEGNYTLSIDNIKLITERNQFSEQMPAEVYLIGYTYSNISKSDDLYISESDFRVIDENGNMAFTYPGSTSKSPQATIKGARCSAEMVFGTHIEGDKLIFCYTDNMFSNTSDFKIILHDIKGN